MLMKARTKIFLGKTQSILLRQERHILGGGNRDRFGVGKSKSHQFIGWHQRSKTFIGPILVGSPLPTYQKRGECALRSDLSCVLCGLFGSRNLYRQLSWIQMVGSEGEPTRKVGRYYRFSRMVGVELWQGNLNRIGIAGENLRQLEPEIFQRLRYHLGLHQDVLLHGLIESQSPAYVCFFA